MHHRTETESAPARRFLPVLLLLFVGSGCAALIYEIVWFQLLQLVIGSSAVSLGVLLGTFMGGMCLGSLLLPRFISARRHPLRVYALLEIGIALIGVIVVFCIPLVSSVYVSSIGPGQASVLLRGAVCAICLLPPTLLMGATLPAIARWVESTPRGVSWLGFFYGGNIVGAVFGCLLAGFYLLRVHDAYIATYVAAALNIAVALLALAIAGKVPYVAAHSAPVQLRESSGATWHIYLAIALSGMTALAAEVVWTRLLSLMLGATVYTFSIILSVFLLGLGIGSSAGAAIARTARRPALALGACQLLLALCIAWAAFTLATSLPYWPIDPTLSTKAWFMFQLDILRCGWAFLPAAILWGASFPLALAAVAGRGRDPGHVVGGLYAANTVGAIVGALGASLLLVRHAGTQHAQQLLVLVTIVAALLVLLPVMRSWPKPAAGGTLLLIAAVAGSLAYSIPSVPGLLVAYGRYLPTRRLIIENNQIKDPQADVIFAGEGLNSSVAVTHLRNSPVYSFHVSGRIEASTEPQDMRLQRMLGHIPALVHPKPKSVLIVGCGAGVTAGTFVLYPDVERIVICEIEPLIPQVVAKHFAKQNYDVVNDPRVQVVYDDARHYILTTQEKFDIITSDPIHPWVKGSATLYTREYFELVKKHLNPGGVVTQWVPLYESSPEVVKSEVATFFDVFTDGTMWSNDVDGDGYDVVLLATDGQTSIDLDYIYQRLGQDDHKRVVQSLQEVGFPTPMDLLATFGGRAADMRPWLADAEINFDRNLRLQYLAGMNLNAFQSGRILDQMLEHRKFPEGLFSGSERRLQTLYQAIDPLPGNR